MGWLEGLRRSAHLIVDLMWNVDNLEHTALVECMVKS